jgi:hypothetical protein
MKRRPITVLAVVAVLAAAGALAFTAVAQNPPGKGTAAAPPPETPPPSVPTLAGLMERQLKWGMTHAEVTDVYNSQQGLFEKDYTAILARTQPGIAMDNVRAEMNGKKVAFAQSWTVFGDTPNGYDSLPIRNEYTYKNNEALQKVSRNGRTRYLFYFSDKLWKIYEEFPLKSDAALGASYQEAVTKINTALGVAGRVRAADPANGIERATTDWVDNNSHMKALDRGSNVVALSLADRQTLRNLDSLRANKPVDAAAVDPSIMAVTKKGVSDPNAAQPMPSGSVKPGQKPPKK